MGVVRRDTVHRVTAATLRVSESNKSRVGSQGGEIIQAQEVKFETPPKHFDQALCKLLSSHQHQFALSQSPEES